MKATKGIILKKTKKEFERPTFMDTVAKMIIVASERSACLFYEVGAAIFKNDQVLSFGYNGPSRGDVHCFKVGCARIVDGNLKKGGGLCRGSHAELNAIGNAARNGVNINDASMMVTFRPCYSCAKQMVNQGIKKVYYIFDYDNDDGVDRYFRRLGVKLEKYSSNNLKKWIAAKQ